MVFIEKKTDAGYEYEVEEVFGTLKINSTTQLAGDILDDMVVLLLKRSLNAEEIRGEIKHDEGVVSYVLKPRPTWEDDDDDICENTPTLTNEQVKGSTRTGLFVQNVVPNAMSWCKRFVGAFREAWRKR